MTYATNNHVIYAAPMSPKSPAVSRQPERPRVLNAYHGITTGQASSRKKPKSCTEPTPVWRASFWSQRTTANRGPKDKNSATTGDGSICAVAYAAATSEANNAAPPRHDRTD